MELGKQKVKSRVKYYWYTWICWVLLFFLIRIALGELSEKQASYIIFSYILPAWLAVMAINFYEGDRLIEYLRKNHHDKWEEVTTVPLLGSGCCNNFRTFEFIFSKDDLDDPNIVVLKSMSKKLLALTLTVFFSFPPITMALYFI